MFKIIDSRRGTKRKELIAPFLLITAFRGVPVCWLSPNGNIFSFTSSFFSQAPKPIHFLNAYDNSYSKMNKEHKYKDKDEYKDNDKDKDAEKITESLLVCYIFGILMTQAFQE